MKIIKDKQIIEDSWKHIADEEEIANGDITVSLTRWNKEKDALANHQGNIGIRVAPADDVAEIADDLKNIELVAVELPAFTDGRAFTHARLLRSRYGYQGEIRAVGSYMADQAFYLQRVGVNAFELENEAELSAALSTLNDFTVKYQASTN